MTMKAPKFYHGELVEVYYRIAGQDPSEQSARILERLCAEEGLQPIDAEFRLATFLLVASDQAYREILARASLLQNMFIKHQEAFRINRQEYLTREVEIVREVKEYLNKIELLTTRRQIEINSKIQNIKYWMWYCSAVVTGTAGFLLYKVGL